MTEAEWLACEDDEALAKIVWEGASDRKVRLIACGCCRLVWDWLVDDRENQETTLTQSEELDNRRRALSDALSVLNDRERRIFEARRLAEDPVTLEELADEFGVSRERVRQIEVRAFEKVQKAVRNRVAAMEQPHAQPVALATH